MAGRKSTGWLVVAIVVLVLVVAFVLKSVGMLSATSGGIDFAFRPLTTTRNADGSYTAEVEVIKSDQWSWNELDVEGKKVLSNNKDAEVRLVSELPSDPVPERFVLKFQIDEFDNRGEAVRLRVKLRVKASKHGGFSSGSRSKSELVTLELPEVH